MIPSSVCPSRLADRSRSTRRSSAKPTTSYTTLRDTIDVGTLTHYAEPLKRITDSAFKEGEHAE